jgi:hypothetical protein
MISIYQLNSDQWFKLPDMPLCMRPSRPPNHPLRSRPASPHFSGLSFERDHSFQLHERATSSELRPRFPNRRSFRRRAFCRVSVHYLFRPFHMIIWVYRYSQASPAMLSRSRFAEASLIPWHNAHRSVSKALRIGIDREYHILPHIFPVFLQRHVIVYCFDQAPYPNEPVFQTESLEDAAQFILDQHALHIVHSS